MWAAALVLLLVAAESVCLYLACRWVICGEADEEKTVVYEVAEK